MLDMKAYALGLAFAAFTVINGAAALQKTEIEKWHPLIKQAGIKAE
jgi:hypothetical protein